MSDLEVMSEAAGGEVTRLLARLHDGEADAHARLLGDPEHPDLAVDWYNLGNGYQQLGRFADGEKAIREAGRLLVAAHGESHPRLVNVWLALNFSLVMRGDFVAAEDCERRAEALLGSQFADSHPRRATLQMIRARRQLFVADDRAVASARAAVGILRQEENVDLSSGLSILGTALFVNRHFEAAAEAFAESLEIKTELRGAGDARTRLQRAGLGLSRWRLSADAAGLADATATLEAMLRDGQGETRQFADAAAWLAAVLESAAPEQAAAWREEGERALASLYPDGHP